MYYQLSRNLWREISKPKSWEQWEKNAVVAIERSSFLWLHNKGVNELEASLVESTGEFINIISLIKTWVLLDIYVGASGGQFVSK